VKVGTLIKMLSKCDPSAKVYLKRPAPADDAADRAVYGIITGGELVRLEPGEGGDDDGYYEAETVREAGYQASDVIIEPV